MQWRPNNYVEITILTWFRNNPVDVVLLLFWKQNDDFGLTILPVVITLTNNGYEHGLEIIILTWFPENLCEVNNHGDVVLVSFGDNNNFGLVIIPMVSICMDTGFETILVIMIYKCDDMLAEERFQHGSFKKILWKPFDRCYYYEAEIITIPEWYPNHVKMKVSKPYPNDYSK